MVSQVFRNVDDEKFFSRHDMIWTKKPRSWDEAPFIGSGLVGSLLYFNSKNRLVLTLGDTSVYDNRPHTAEESNELFLTPRLPLGRFLLGGITRSSELRLDLYNAQVTGSVRTLTGSFRFNCFAPHGKKLVILELSNVNDEFPLEFTASEAVSPRQKYMLRTNKNRASASYAAPKSAYSYQHKDVNYCIQPLFTKGFSVVAYKTLQTENGACVLIAVGQGSEEGIVTSQLSFELDNAAINLGAIKNKHLQYWHNFYAKSFLSLNDAATEEFYWLQLYKLASAGCESGKVYDTCGPWLPETTAWPGAWWNLNVQLTYSPLMTSNHTELVLPLATELRDGLQELTENVPAKYRYDSAAVGRFTTSSLRSPVSCPGDPNATQETGNLLWALHVLWQCYLRTQDNELLKTTIFPILKRAVAYYRHFLLLDNNGKLHIPPTLSPEYPKMGFDANYDLALLKWGLSTLIRICEELDMNETALDEWKWILQRLPDYPADEKHGLHIASDVPYAVSHRHYSHLLMIYPLRTLDLADDANRALAKRSLEYWQSKPDALQGYSYTGAASMYALLRDGDKAYERLTKLWSGGFIRPNTMYSEGGNPVLETPCAAACSVLDMLMQSLDGRLVFLPAIPKVWKDVVFHNFLCEGGFAASAVMRDGKLLWIAVKNENSDSGVCTVEAPLFGNENTVLCCEDFRKEITMPENGLKLKIPKGQTVVIRRPDVDETVVAPATYSDRDCHVYGANKDTMI